MQNFSKAEIQGGVTASTVAPVAVFEVGPCDMSEAEIQDAITMVKGGTDPQTAVMLAKQHP